MVAELSSVIIDIDPYDKGCAEAFCARDACAVDVCMCHPLEESPKPNCSYIISILSYCALLIEIRSMIDREVSCHISLI
jgi:hypothetical protein